MRPRARAVAVGALLCVLPGLAGCAVDGHAVAARTVTAGVDPVGVVRDTDRGDDDRLAAAVVTDLDRYWGRAFPPLADGAAFRPPHGAVSVDAPSAGGGSGSGGGSSPGSGNGKDGSGPASGTGSPCTDDVDEVEGNAYYCPRGDLIAYDRGALLPVLRAQFGDAAVTVVLAHEYGHAVAQRLDDAGSPAPDGPPILREAQADCFGAAFVRAVHDGALPDLRTGPAGVDAALSALVAFRDPIGTAAGDASAHGDAFDRASSFQVGYEQGPPACAAMSPSDRAFTQRAFATPRDASRDGNLPLPDMLRGLGPELDRYLGGVVGARRAGWRAPAVSLRPGGCPPPAGPTGPVAFCPARGEVAVDPGPDLARRHREIGDYASGTLVAQRFGLAALSALGRPSTGPAAGRAALCLAGAFTAAEGPGGPSRFSLSPGDLDEAVTAMLRDPDTARGTDGALGDPTGYGRVATFRSGFTGGADACLTPR